MRRHWWKEHSAHLGGGREKLWLGSKGGAKLTGRARSDLGWREAVRREETEERNFTVGRQKV